MVKIILFFEFFFLLRKILQFHSNLISIETVDEIGYIVIFYFIHKSWHYLQLDIHLYKGAGCPISPVMFVYVFNNLFTGAPIQGLSAISLWIGIQGNGGTKLMTTRAALYHGFQNPRTKLLAAHTPWLTSFSKRKQLGFSSCIIRVHNLYERLHI